MREIIDDMFFWNAEGTFIEDFNKEYIDTKDFIDSILQFRFKCNIQQERGYSRELGDIQTLSYHPISEESFSKEELKVDEPPHIKINFTKAMNDPYQKKI